MEICSYCLESSADNGDEKGAIEIGLNGNEV